MAMLYNQENNPAKLIDHLTIPQLTFQITDNQRADIINQIVRIHNVIVPPLKQETLHITVSLIDRILAMRNTPSDNLHVLGITCLFIATKFEDIVQPTADMMCHFAQQFGRSIMLKSHLHDYEL